MTGAFRHPLRRIFELFSTLVALLPLVLMPSFSLRRPPSSLQGCEDAHLRLQMYLHLQLHLHLSGSPGVRIN